MPTIEHAPAVDDYALAEDFLSLDHWTEYGGTAVGYRLAPEVSLGYGGSLYVPEAGNTRLARLTALAPGETYVFTWRAWPLSGNGVAPQLQITRGENTVTGSIAMGVDGLFPGWNHIAARVTIPENFEEVWLRVQKTPALGGSGYLHRIRAHRAQDEGEDG